MSRLTLPQWLYVSSRLQRNHYQDDWCALEASIANCHCTATEPFHSNPGKQDYPSVLWFGRSKARGWGLRFFVICGWRKCEACPRWGLSYQMMLENCVKATYLLHLQRVLCILGATVWFAFKDNEHTSQLKCHYIHKCFDCGNYYTDKCTGFKNWMKLSSMKPIFFPQLDWGQWGCMHHEKLFLT